MRLTENLNPTNTGLASETTPTKQAWTPGPWNVCKGISNPSNLVVGSPTVVCGPLFEVTLPQHNLGFPQLRAEEQNANAKLIAKAPEMAEALKRFVVAYRAMPDGELSKGLTNRDFLEAARILVEAGAE